MPLATRACELLLCVLVSAVLASVTAEIVPKKSNKNENDNLCRYDTGIRKCVPLAYCDYRFRLEDETLSDSCRLNQEAFDLSPHQLHVAYAGEEPGSALTISWMTMKQVKDSTVWLGNVHSLKKSDAAVKIQSYLKRSGNVVSYHYHATVKGLKPHTRYTYQVGSAELERYRSTRYQVITAQSPTATRVIEGIFFGDLAVASASERTFKYLTEKLNPDKTDFIFHVGGIAYADTAEPLGAGFRFFYEDTYDEFMTKMSRIAAKIPYMVAAGEHEADCLGGACRSDQALRKQLKSFAAYNTRFRMPSSESGGVKNMWYSFVHGPVHFTVVDTETDTNRQALTDDFGDQLAWLLKDLKRATLDRAKVPWLVVVMHHPIYSPTLCNATGVPTGKARDLQKALESMFVEYKVDVVVSAHSRLYSRQYPLSDRIYLEGVSQDGKIYTKPKAPVYITTGAAGSNQGLESFKGSVVWNAVTISKEYGVSRLRADRKEMRWQFVAIKSDQVVDQDLKLAEATVEVKTYYKDEKYSLYNSHATVTGLTPHTEYAYRVGSKASADRQSAVTRVTTARSSDDEKEFDIAIYGDMGVDDNAQKTFKYVLENLPGKVDFVFHLGGISYADNTSLFTPSEGFGFSYEDTYNKFMDEISPVSSTLPYMVLVDNHEAECHSAVCMLSHSKQYQLGDYRAFNTRFKMPSKESGDTENMWYSFEHGPIHFTTINTETDYPDAPNNSYTGGKYGNFGNQLAWLENDLKKADANRANTPWLIVMMHYAIYTRTMSDANGAPKGEALPVQKAFEDLFIKYKVDQVVSGHVHLYSRHYPTAKNQPVMDGVSEDGKTYTNPKAPVYLISGAAGSPEGHEDYDENLKTSWNAVTNNKEYGITKVRVSRKSLSWQFISAESGKVLDDFVITKS
ncbi:hypothetical protein Poli38472_011991 [Pythium oligandrum]|uniref:Purple acid phosphatase n=1 Tax=Pythium oligandrum TaxID=41045 RepID=A0A8K1CQI4_PYTOL|nr:hypothetical protein Poli38472_011991 [Pythium oligandrum]|eukprot:TMW66875.1 hypothetical protein Poli38472_011991 [Pythium oligandrum]